jgi:hypothetical protein
MFGCLVELYAVFGNDPFLIQECFVRSVLADRLARSFFAYDERFHHLALEEAERMREQIATGRQQGHDRRPQDRRRDCQGRSHRAPAGIGPVVELREAFVVRVLLEDGREAVSRTTFPKRRGNSGGEPFQSNLAEHSVHATAETDSASGIGILDSDLVSIDAQASPPGSIAAEWLTGLPPTDDTWNNGTFDDIPAPRWSVSAVWTGSHMILWGGILPANQTGGRYDPATDTWSPTSLLGAPQGRYGHSMVWTGTEMLVWGGDSLSGLLGSGARYDPVADTKPMSNGPIARAGHSTVWTGTKMIVWGGAATSPSRTLNTGASMIRSRTPGHRFQP